MKKNLFLTFCFSLIPGAGQMYQDYMKRGLSIMTLFGIMFAFSIIISAPLFTIPLPIIYAYSFFDTFNIRNKIENGKKEEDEYIWKNTNFDFLSNIDLSKRNTILGSILLLVGVYLLVNNVLRNILYTYDIYWLNIIVDNILSYLPVIIISAVSIGIGIKLLFNKRSR